MGFYVHSRDQYWWLSSFLLISFPGQKIVKILVKAHYTRYNHPSALKRIPDLSGSSSHEAMLMHQAGGIDPLKWKTMPPMDVPTPGYYSCPRASEFGIAATSIDQHC
jgi:hypothetical protein